MITTQAIERIKEIASEAGAIILRVYDDDDFNTEYKVDSSPLTRADKESNKLICDALSLLDANIPIISEENKTILYEERKDFTQVWLVDPLDGTKEFVNRNGEFTVNIALIEEGRPVLGVMYVPVSKELYFATNGNGAFYEKDGKTSQMAVARFNLKDRGLNVVCSRSHLNPQTKEFIDTLDQPHTLSRGSALKFMLVVSGQAHIYPRLAPTMEWDTAAAQCILEEAGGFVVDFYDKSPLKYNKKDLTNPWFLAGGRMMDDESL